jgi:hypothetical protein
MKGGPNELVHHYRRKGAARHIIDMVGLTILLAYPRGEEGVFYFFNIFLLAFATPREGGGVIALWLRE